jgi:hypothetical protein
MSDFQCTLNIFEDASDILSDSGSTSEISSHSVEEFLEQISSRISSGKVVVITDLYYSIDYSD